MSDFELPLAYQTQKFSGMPDYAEDGPQTSWYEFIPPWLFYAPIVVYMVGLAMRYGGWLSASAANPTLPNGGLWGESKTELCSTFGDKLNASLAEFATLRATEADRHAAAKRLMAEQDFQFPIVVKPDIGCRGTGVKLVENEAGLRAYIDGFPEDADLLLQRFVPWEGEAGVFVIKRPGQTEFEIFSLTLKYLPFVTGDGQSTLRQLIEADPRAVDVMHLYEARHAERLEQVVPADISVRLAFSGSHCRGAVFKDGRDLITPELVAVFAELAADCPEFHFGRFDVRFKSIEGLSRGEDFAIVELNGGGAEATHIWDSKTPWREALSTLAEQYRLLWQIGWQNRKRGFSATPALTQLRMHLREQRLARYYPATD